MNPNQELTLNYIINNPGCTYEEITHFTGMSIRNTINQKNILVALGYIYELSNIDDNRRGGHLKRFFPSKSNIKKKYK